MRVRRIESLAFGVVVALGIASGAARAAETVVMSGLDNPRGLAFSPNGALYVAEAGRGAYPDTAPPYCGPNAAGEDRCYGPTGAISRLWKGVQERVASDLPSHALRNDGTSAVGPNDISFQGTGGAYIPIGLGRDLDYRDELGPAGPLFGTLLHMSASGHWSVVADVSQHEEDENPGGGPVDTNPFGVLAEPGARFVADAGANALLSVFPDGRVETVAIFPSRAQGRPTDAVPTSVVRGPDGALYVGELSGVPFAPGAANIYRVVPGDPPIVTVHLSGFKTIMDIAFGSDGSLYVVETATGGVFFPPNSGKLTQVAPDGTRSVVRSGLDRPTSVAIGADGAIYVTNHGITPGQGEVLKITP